MTTPAALTRKAFAEHIGVVPSYVTKLAQNGRLVFTDDGKRIKVVESLQRIEETRDPNRDDVKRRHERERARPQEERETPQEEKSPEAISFAEARAKKEHYLALKAQSEYEQMIGKLCEVADVRNAGADIGAAIRAKIETMADRLAPELAVEKDEARVHALMVEYNETMLAEIGGQIAKSMERIAEA